ncbi:MAG: hypothetical protein JWM78_3861 [Verrucomicrobiaceae bacterium]|nr:hypothetical protein [Verrucomicrobiaceae bacterium]
MMRSQKCRIAIALLLLSGSSLAVDNKNLAAENNKPETPVLGRDEYRTPLDQVIVTGREPYWQKQAPRWEQPKVEMPPPENPSRLQWAPRYDKEERDGSQELRDPRNPQPRLKLFEFKF